MAQPSQPVSTMPDEPAREVMKPLTKTTVNIILVGQTGAGKTTFLSLLDNLFQNKGPFDLKDTWRKELESGLDISHSQTSEPSVYPIRFGNTMFNILDTPGIADTRGIERDKYHLKKVNAMVKQMGTVDAVLLIVDGTKGRLDVSTNLTFETIKMMFPRSITDNIGVIMTHVTGPSTLKFRMHTLGGDLEKSSKWPIENPLALSLGFQEMESEMSPEEKGQERNKIKVAYDNTVDRLNEWLKWLDNDLRPMPTKEIDELYQKSANIEAYIDKALKDIELESKELAKQQEAKDNLSKTKNTRAYYEDLYVGKKRWTRTVTRTHNTFCDVDGCNYNCHESCNLPKITEYTELGKYCEVFDFGESTTCLVCTHALEKHRHYNQKKIEVDIPIPDEVATILEQAKKDGTNYEQAEKSAQAIIDAAKARVVEARKVLQQRIEDFNATSLSKNFSGHIHAAIKLLRHQREKAQANPIAADQLPVIEAAIEHFEKKLKEISSVMGTAESEALDRIAQGGK
ncbi:hypothetical protein CTheo_7843 [Ceratobasidium theobromae]|uniref:AIG1-type G domain-containing protein n=1 Tax=Ceratobasidium theobromae TaxID=1582974 RepID=A0A5N5QA99_9AGAM|nr:hypothetical protein CTheo_7843 [Ceratobasidium theobromae]